MKRLILVGASACALAAFCVLPAEAAPVSSVSYGPLIQETILVKGGHDHGGGHGHGHGWGRHGGHWGHGWSRGRKVGWRGRGCPPGLWKQGRC